ncbi:basic leucine zipper 23-like [Typha latifolia]|uniref:basic leucine zipper 23-like n=1 Tax=Typha latifolia TaxID=4733 RepID=UPI003C305F78
MDEGEIDLSNPEVFSGPNGGENPLSSCSMDSFFDEILKDEHHACTHTHTCNPPGPDLTHTHTCFHVHTKILSAPADDTAESAEKCSVSKKRPCGNREAVRKYREKKKARAASLEEEVVRLTALNEQLMKRLQGQAALEAEVMRLRCLLVDIRGRIEGEIGSFPYQKPARAAGMLASNVSQANLLAGAQVVNSCDFRCDYPVHCVNPGMQGKGVGENGESNGQGFGACEISNVKCTGSSNSGSKNILPSGRGNGNAAPVGCSSDAEKI